MKKNDSKRVMICLMLILQMLMLPVSANSVQMDMSVTQGCNSIDGAMPLLGSGQLVENCKAAVLYERNSDTLLYAWNADTQMYPASLVKIMTALVALEKGNLADVISVRQDVLDTVPADAVSCDLVADEILTLQDLLYCMMVDSANDAATVLADHVCGSQDAFVAAMNQRAEEMGCTGTVFTNVHGLHDERQVTTARDIARILSYAMENEQFAELFSTVNYTVPATNKSEQRQLITGNYLISTENKDDVQIYYDERVTGGRTGTTESGDRCIASTAQQNDLDVVCVVMGSSSVYKPDGYTVSTYGGYKETSKLLDLGLTDYSIAEILYEDQALKQYSVLNGDSTVTAAPAVAISSVLPSGITQNQLNYRYSGASSVLEAPINKGDKIADLEVWYNDLCIVKTDLFALNSVAHVQDRVKEQTPQQGSGQLFLWILAAIIVAVLIVAVILVAMRTLNSMKSASNQKRRRNRSSERRRSR